MSALRTEAQGKRRKPDRFQPLVDQQKRSAATGWSEVVCPAHGSAGQASEAGPLPRLRPTSRSGARLLAGRKWEMPPGGFHSVEAGPLPTATRPAEAERGRAAVGSEVNFTRILVKLVDVGWGRPASDHRLTIRSGARSRGGRKQSQVGRAPVKLVGSVLRSTSFRTSDRPTEAERGQAELRSEVV